VQGRKGKENNTDNKNIKSYFETKPNRSKGKKNT